MKLAVFDLDGTMYRCNTLFAFIRAQKECRVLSRFADCTFVKVLDRYCPGCRRALMLFSLRYFSNAGLELRAREFVCNYLPSQQRSSAFALLERLRSAQYTIMLSSSAPHFLVRSCAHAIDADYWCASIYKDGRLSFDLSGQKEQYLPAHEILFVCTDNLNDLPLLHIATEKCVYATCRTVHAWKALVPISVICEED